MDARRRRPATASVKPGTGSGLRFRWVCCAVGSLGTGDRSRTEAGEGSLKGGFLPSLNRAIQRLLTTSS